MLKIDRPIKFAVANAVFTIGMVAGVMRCCSSSSTGVDAPVSTAGSAAVRPKPRVPASPPCPLESGFYASMEDLTKTKCVLMDGMRPFALSFCDTERAKIVVRKQADDAIIFGLCSLIDHP